MGRPRFPLRIGLVALAGLVTSSSAWALDCAEIQAMLEAGLPPEVVVTAIEAVREPLDDTQLACLRQAGVGEAILRAAGAETPVIEVPAPEEWDSVRGNLDALRPTPFPPAPSDPVEWDPLELPPSSAPPPPAPDEGWIDLKSLRDEVPPRPDPPPVSAPGPARPPPVSAPPPLPLPPIPPPPPDPYRAINRTFVLGGVFGAYLGGSAGFAIGDASGGDIDSSRASGVLLGSILGAGAGVGGVAVIRSIRPDWYLDRDQFVFSGTTAMLGGYTGTQIARTFVDRSDPDEARRIALAGALGSIAGSGLAVALQHNVPTSRTTLDLDLAALVGWQAGAGIGDMAGLHSPEDRHIRAPITLGTTAVLATTSAILSTASARRPSAGVMAISMGHGTWIGAWSPLLFTRDPDGLQIAGGLRLGLGGGYFLAHALAPLGDLTPRSLALQGAGFATGNALGAGIPLALGVDPSGSTTERRAVIAPMLAAGLLGQVAGAAIAPKYALSEDDVALLTVLESWTAYQAIGWGVYASHATRQTSVHMGHVLTAAGGGSLLALALAPAVEITPAESILAASAGGWGTWYGAWTGHLLRLPPELAWTTALTSGDLTLLLTAGLAAGPVRADWLDVAYIDGLGLLGGATGALVGIVASPDTDPVAISSLIGTTIGLGGGLYLAAKPGTALPVATLPKLRLPLRLRTRVRPSVRIHPWLDPEDGDPGVWVSVEAHDW